MPTSIEKTPRLLADLLTTAAKHKPTCGVGIEVERIGLWEDGSRFGYHAAKKSLGAKELLMALAPTLGGTLHTNDSGDPLGIDLPKSKVSLEPGSQLEYASSVSCNLSDLVAEISSFEKAVDQITQGLGVHWLNVAVDPLHLADETELIPSHRYQIMTDYFGRTGDLGTSMMRLTSSVQINLDYSSEEEAIEMLRVALLLVPVSYALFSNSPYYGGKKTDFISFRSEIWRRTDKERAGIFPLAFEPSFSFKNYESFLWNYPLMFAWNDKGKSVATGGLSLTQIDSGQLPGVQATELNQRSAIQQLFTEARIKPGYIEVRSVDGLSPEMRYAATAFWLGILYSEKARKWVMDKFYPAEVSQLVTLWSNSSRYGLATPFNQASLRDVCSELYQLSRKGLLERGRKEESFLTPLEKNIEAGISPAERVLERVGSNPLLHALKESNL